MKIFGLQKFTLIDYPGKLACIIFTGGCNFKCPYCHNPCLILDPESQKQITQEEFLTFLHKRQNKLDAVVISGGEPTLQADLEKFIGLIKQYNFLVKLDTNGSKPAIIKNLITQKLIDAVGIDYKAPSESYQKISQNSKVLGKNILKLIEHAINKLGSKNVDIRTTVHRDLISEKDLHTMWNELKTHNVKTWHLQQYHQTEVLDLNLDAQTWSNRELIDIAHNISPTIDVRIN